MTEVEQKIKSWCETRDLSVKAMALLCELNPDAEDLDNLEVEEKNGFVVVNGFAYQVYTIEDMANAQMDFEENLKEYYIDQLSNGLECLIDYIKWEDFFDDSDFDYTDYVIGSEEIWFDNELYYYLEWGDL